MKKLIVIAFIISLMIIFASCRTKHTCPAYHNGSVHKADPIEDTRA